MPDAPPTPHDGFPDSVLAADPVELFQAWFDQVTATDQPLPEAVALATADGAGVPSARMVLLKGVDERGFVFFTNHESRKAKDLAENPRAALCFHWASLERQVRVSGRVERVDHEESEAYFRSRPRGSRLGAWASKQSAPMADRAELEGRLAEAAERFGDGDVPLPDFWGGYRIVPEVIEFWQGRADRLHDRLVFRRTDGEWSTERLYP